MKSTSLCAAPTKPQLAAEHFQRGGAADEGLGRRSPDRKEGAAVEEKNQMKSRRGCDWMTDRDRRHGAEGSEAGLVESCLSEVYIGHIARPTNRRPLALTKKGAGSEGRQPTHAH